MRKGHKVTSISRSGRPPSFYTANNNNNLKNKNVDADWADQVNWLTHTIQPKDKSESESESESASSQIQAALNFPEIDAAISCIGNVDPDPDWDKLSFFGLNFNDEVLFKENGLVNERAAGLAKDNRAQRFVFISVSYEVAKTLEGPLDGYMSGKRHAENAICNLFGEDDSIVLAPSLMYGGKRFPTMGAFYNAFVRLGIVKAYGNGMDALRNLSSSPIEDWVEKSLLSPPVDVEVAARVACAGALGLVTRDAVGSRRQGFCNEFGKDVIYDDFLYIDGTYELERIDDSTNNIPTNERSPADQSADFFRPITTGTTMSDQVKEPIWEGALLRKGPYLYPLPVIAFFSAIFCGIATGQFTTTQV